MDYLGVKKAIIKLILVSELATELSILLIHLLDRVHYIDILDILSSSLLCA